jgi:hypothetical protein
MKSEYTSKLVVILIIITTLVLTGCGSSSSNQVYKIGTEGLVLEFSKANPESVYEQEEFGTSLFIRNIGSYSVTEQNPGTLRIIYDNYRLTSQTQDANIYGIALEGKSINYPKGSEVPVDFYFESKRLTNLRENSKTEISYNLCYPYVTEYSTMTCIDTKTASKTDAAVACTAETYNGMAGQGAPIVITKIEPEIMLQKDYVRPQYKVYVENLGKGYVMNRQNCDMSNIQSLFGTGYNEFSGRVTVYAELSGKKLDCGPDKTGIMRLSDSESFITCSLPKDADNTYSRTKRNYITPLTIRIEYTYVILDKQELEIKRNDLIEPEVTQGICLSSQLEVEGKCISKCKYCSNHTDSYLCQDNKPYAGFKFREDFSCNCNIDQCNEKKSKGSCIEGYCTGDSYCCSNLDCKEYQVEYDGKCVDKCEYCSKNPTDKKICPTPSLVGFSCQKITGIECDNKAKKGNCVRGYCGGTTTQEYCTRSMDSCTEETCESEPLPIAVKPSCTEEACNICPETHILDEMANECLTICDYCAKIDSNDERCKYNGIMDGSNQAKYRITSSFSCSCRESEIHNNVNTNLPIESYTPNIEYCGGSIYCCDKTKILASLETECAKIDAFGEERFYSYDDFEDECATDCEWCGTRSYEPSLISPILKLDCSKFTDYQNILTPFTTPELRKIYLSCDPCRSLNRIENNEAKYLYNSATQRCDINPKYCEDHPGTEGCINCKDNEILYKNTCMSYCDYCFNNALQGPHANKEICTVNLIKSCGRSCNEISPSNLNTPCYTDQYYKYNTVCDYCTSEEINTGECSTIIKNVNSNLCVSKCDYCRTDGFGNEDMCVFGQNRIDARYSCQNSNADCNVEPKIYDNSKGNYCPSGKVCCDDIIFTYN